MGMSAEIAYELLRLPSATTEALRTLQCGSLTDCVRIGTAALPPNTPSAVAAAQRTFGSMSLTQALIDSIVRLSRTWERDSMAATRTDGSGSLSAITSGPTTLSEPTSPNASATARRCVKVVLSL